MPVAHQVLQFAQVQAQPADDCLGNWNLGGRLRRFGFGFTHDANVRWNVVPRSGEGHVI